MREVARYVHSQVGKMVKADTDGRVWVELVEVREHSGNSAIYQEIATPNRRSEGFDRGSKRGGALRGLPSKQRFVRWGRMEMNMIVTRLTLPDWPAWR